MPRIPGSFNGGIPPNLKWEDHPTKNACSDQVEIHAPNCDGKCEQTPITFSEMELLNEYREWGRVGMNPESIKTATDLLQMDLAMKALIAVLDVDVHALDEKFREIKLETLRGLRLANQEDAKRQMLGLGPKIIGPDGKPLT